MSRKIIGVTVGSSLPKPNFNQTDPTKGDYIKNKPDFEGLKDQVNTVSGLVGDTEVSKQISDAIAAIEPTITEEEIPNLYIWKKYSGDPSGYSIGEETSISIGTTLYGSTSTSYSDEIKIVDGKLSLGDIAAVTGSTADDFNVLKGKYVSELYIVSQEESYSKYYYIEPDATITYNNGVGISPVREVVLNSSSTLGYVASKSFSTYPSSGEHTDGYWYKYYRQLGDAAVVDDSSVNFTETDPTVPAWAKEANKPTYTASEVGALPATTVIPDALSDLAEDSTHRTVTDTEKSTWNAKANKSDIPTVPTKVSAFENDKGYLTEHQSLSGYAKTSDIPTKTSELTNDSGFATETYVDNAVSNINMSSGFVVQKEAPTDKTVLWVDEDDETDETVNIIPDELIAEAVEDYLAEHPIEGGGTGEPGVSATHEWNGTTLTVTSASGTSSADLKGAKGDAGKTAYQYAQDGGYEGTEQEFAEKLASSSGYPNPCVMDYGAKGDGTTDDTAAFQTALAENRVVYVPGGTYKLNGELVIGDNCCLELSQDTVLVFTQTSGNCIVLGMSSTLKGNHATIKVPYAFDGHVLHAYSSDHTSAEQLAVPPWGKWDPMWKSGRYVSDVNICKADSRGFHYAVNPGECKGTAVYISANGASNLTYMWGVQCTGLRIAGAFTYGIHAYNPNKGWTHEMRIDGFVDACETGVFLEDCNRTYISVVVQPRRAYSASEVYAPYAKNGIKLVRSVVTDLSGSRVWDWTTPDNPDTPANDKTTLYEPDNEYQAIAMYGDCNGTIISDYMYHDYGDTRKRIYTDTPRNLETLTILQEPIDRFFKIKEGIPYCNSGSVDKRLILQDEMQEYFDTKIVQRYVDALPGSIDSDKSIFSETGYKVGYINGSGNFTVPSGAYYYATGFIEAKPGDTVYVSDMFFKNAISASTIDNNAKIAFYKSDFSYINHHTATSVSNGSTTYGIYNELSDGFSFKINNNNNTKDVFYIRISVRTADMGANPVVSINEEIKSTVEGFLGDNVKVNGGNIVLMSPGGKAFVLAVSDSGTLSTTSVT